MMGGKKFGQSDEKNQDFLKKWRQKAVTGWGIPHRSFMRSGSMGPWRLLKLKRNLLLQLKDQSCDKVQLWPSSGVLWTHYIASFYFQTLLKSEEDKRNKKKSAERNVRYKSPRGANPWGDRDDNSVTAELNQRRVETLTESQTRGKKKKEHERHWLWQQGSLPPLWLSVVGGRLMSTTLLPGDSSCPDLSDICFWDTIR